jgi:hypothetical protein
MSKSQASAMPKARRSPSQAQAKFILKMVKNQLKTRCEATSYFYLKP